MGRARDGHHRTVILKPTGPGARLQAVHAGASDLALLGRWTTRRSALPRSRRRTRVDFADCASQIKALQGKEHCLSGLGVTAGTGTPLGPTVMDRLGRC